MSSRTVAAGVMVLVACGLSILVVRKYLEPEDAANDAKRIAPAAQSGRGTGVYGNGDPDTGRGTKVVANADGAATPRDVAGNDRQIDNAQEGGGQSAEREKDKPPFDGWEKPAAVLLFSGEQHGYVEPCGCSLNQLGGLSRRADLLRQIAARNWPVTAFDAGGLVNNPTRQQGKFKFDMMLKCLVDMRYSGVAMGVEEVQLGFDFLSFHKPDELPFLSANLVLFENPNFDLGPLRKRIVTVGEVKIGVTAVFGNSLKEKLPPGGGEAGGFQFEVLDPVESLKKALSELESDKPDLLVLLSHARPDETKALAASFPQFHIIVTTGGPEDPDPRPNFLGKTLLVPPGQKGKFAPVVGYFPEDKKERLKFRLIPLDDRRFKDTPGIVEHMRYYQEDMLKERNLIANEPAIDDPRNVDPVTGLPAENNAFVGAKACGECHKSAFEIWEGTRHADATESLKTGPRNKRPNPAYISRAFDPECIACHVTGWDPQKFVRYKSGFSAEDATSHLVGQQCENCHGPGGRHSELERQWAKDNENKNGKPSEEVVAWRKFQRLSRKTAFDLCAKCHDNDNDPKFKSETFGEYWDQVAHPGKE